MPVIQSRILFGGLTKERNLPAVYKSIPTPCFGQSFEKACPNVLKLGGEGVLRTGWSFPQEAELAHCGGTEGTLRALDCLQ